MKTRLRSITAVGAFGLAACAPARSGQEPAAKAHVASASSATESTENALTLASASATPSSVPPQEVARPRPKSYAKATISASSTIVCTLAEAIPECFRIDSGESVLLPLARAKQVAVARDAVCLLADGDGPGGEVRCTSGFDESLLRGATQLFPARYGEDLCVSKLDGTIQCSYQFPFAWADKREGVRRAGPHRFDAEPGSLVVTDLYAHPTSPFCWLDAVNKQPQRCGESPPERAMLQISPHLYHTCGILTAKRELLCWNGGMYGNTAWIKHEPKQFKVGPLRHLVDGLYGLLDNGAVLRWADRDTALDDGGVVGPDIYSALEQPSLIAPPGSFVAIDGSLDQVCGVTIEGAIRCAGRFAVTKPQRVGGLGEVSEISAAGDVSCAREKSGTVRCWGRPSSIAGASWWSPKEVPATHGFTAPTGEAAVGAGISVPKEVEGRVIVSGAKHSCALVDGAVLCWGERGHGQLGTGYWHEVRR